MDIQWVLLADQIVLFVICGIGTAFAYRASQNSRWLQEVITPIVANIEKVVDPNYPKPLDPPPVED